MKTATAKCSQRKSAKTPTLLEAAKDVVALSGWSKELPDTRSVYQTSYMAIEVLKRAIEETENPKLTLAPEPLPRGL